MWCDYYLMFVVVLAAIAMKVMCLVFIVRSVKWLVNRWSANKLTREFKKKYGIIRN